MIRHHIRYPKGCWDASMRLISRPAAALIVALASLPFAQFVVAQQSSPLGICIGSEGLVTEDRVLTIVNHTISATTRNTRASADCCPLMSVGDEVDRFEFGTQLGQETDGLADRNLSAARDTAKLVQFCGDRIVMAAFFAVYSDFNSLSRSSEVPGLWELRLLTGGDGSLDSNN